MARKKPSGGRWVQQAIKRPGALRATAKRMGLIRGDEPLTEADLARLRARAKETGNTRLLRQANLAKTLKRLPRRRKKKGR